MPMYTVTIKVEGDISKTEIRRVIRVMTKALRKDAKERNAKLGNRRSRCPAGFHVDHTVPLRGKTVCGLKKHNKLSAT